MITGAQTEIPAIGLSAPSIMYVRKTFEPEITVDALNKYAFNIVPEGDIMPQIDDLTKHYQSIKCTAPANKKMTAF